MIILYNHEFRGLWAVYWDGGNCVCLLHCHGDNTILAPQTFYVTNKHTHAYHTKESYVSAQRSTDKALLHMIFVFSSWRKRHQHMNASKSRDYKSFRCASIVLYAFGNKSLESDC
jgi:hypothetical protein